MSDDAITSISQFSANAKANQKLDHSAGAGSQDNDFKQFISQEESRLQRDNGKLAKNTDIETDTSGVESSSLKKSDEASAGQKGEGVSGSSGNTLPNLALHGGALAVGRVIYTTQSAAVTSESLSKFMARQGLVSETLMEGRLPESEIPNGGSGGEKLLHSRSLETLGQSRSEPYSDTTNRFLLTKGLLAQGTGEGDKPIGSPNEAFRKSDIESRKLESEEAKSIAQRLVFEGKNGPETGLNKVEAKSLSEPFVQSNERSISQTGQTKNITVEPIHAEKVGFPEISRPQLSRAFWQNKPSNETAGLEEPLGDRLAIDKDLKEGTVSKSGLSMVKNDGEAKFQGSNGLTEKDQYLMTTDRTSEIQKDKQSQSFLTQHVLEINARKTQREMSQNSPQESSYADAGQSRVEFKGALREAQRLVSAGNLNNLTDSYESWSSRFGEVLAHRIAGYINKETWSVHFRLNPASLGEISLEIDFNEKGLEGRFGSNEESTRQLLQDTLPKLRIALRDILEENQGLKFDVGDNESSNRDSDRERDASNSITEELNFESEVLVGRTMDSELGSMVGLDILV